MHTGTSFLSRVQASHWPALLAPLCLALGLWAGPAASAPVRPIPPQGILAEYMFTRHAGESYAIHLGRHGLLAFGYLTAPEWRYVCLSRRGRRSAYRLLDGLRAVPLPTYGATTVNGFDYQELRAHWRKRYYRYVARGEGSGPIPEPAWRLMRKLHKLRHHHRRRAKRYGDDEAVKRTTLCAKRSRPSG